MSLSFPAWLVSRMSSRCLTNGDVAHACGTTDQAVSDWRRGVYAPSGTKAHLLAKVLGVEESEIRERLTAERVASASDAHPTLPEVSERTEALP